MSDESTGATLESVRQQLSTRFSYLDVLALAMADSGVEQFTGDSSRWGLLVRELRAAYPELLNGIWFSERGFSEELEDFFRVMARSGFLSFANPSYERIDLKREARESIQNRVPPALEGHREDVRSIGHRLKELALLPDNHTDGPQDSES
jgi:hypothetical protein